MTARIVKDAPSVQRVMFGKYITPTAMGHSQSQVLSFTSKIPSPLTLTDGEPGQISGMIQISKNAETKLCEAITELVMPPYSMETAKGPYADKNGVVQRLTKEVVGDTGSNKDLIIARVTDILRPLADAQAEYLAPRTYHSEDYNFMFNEGYASIPDVLPYAGELLAQAQRRTVNLETGASSIILTHVMEPYILAASVLRQAGISAYPSLAVWSQNETEFYTPLMSLVDLTSEVPLQTFALMPIHPNLSSIIVLSDAAVMGVLNIIVAETRAKHFCTEIVEYNKQGTTVPQDILDNQLQRIANALFEGHRLWPGTHFIQDAVGFFTNEVAKAIAVINLSDQGAVQALGPAASQLIGMFSSPAKFHEICAEINRINPTLMQFLENVLNSAVTIGQDYAGAVLTNLSACIEAGKPVQTFEGNRRQT